MTQGRVASSEWTKLRSLRSTLVSSLVAVILTIGLPCLFAAVTANRWSHMRPRERLDRHPLDIATAGVNLSQLAIGVLGVLVISGEYSTGMIRATLAAVPRRLPVLWAKIAVFGVATFVLMLPSVLVAFFASQAILRRHHHILQISFSSPGVARTVIGGALYLTAGRRLHAGPRRDHAEHRGRHRGICRDLLRDPAADEHPADELEPVDLRVPASSAARDVFALTHGPHDLSPWPGFALFCAYTARGDRRCRRAARAARRVAVRLTPRPPESRPSRRPR